MDFVVGCFGQDTIFSLDHTCLDRQARPTTHLSVFKRFSCMSYMPCMVKQLHID